MLDESEYGELEAVDESAVTSFPPPLERTVKSIVDELVAQRDATGLSVLVIRDGVRYQLHYGEAIRGTGIKPNSSTLYAIGSVTKSFTATLLGVYEREGLVEFDDTLDQHTTYPLASARQTITLEDLATHHSGLPENPPGGESAFREGTYTADMKKLMETLDDCPGGVCSAPIPATDPDEYSNYGFAVLANVLAKKGGYLGLGYTSVQAALMAKVINPLGMTSTNNKANLTESGCLDAACPYSAYGACDYSTACHGTFSSRASIGYDDNGGRDGDEGSDDNIKAGSGVLWSTPADMLKWLAYNMDSNSGAPQGLREVLPELHRVRAATNMGLAWRRVATPDGRDVWAKTGVVASFRTYIAFQPGENEGVVVLSNSTSVGSVSTLARDIIDAIAD